MSDTELRSKPSPAASRMLVTVFLCVVTAPLLVTAIQLGRGPGTPREESTARTPRPPHDVRTLIRWPGEFKWYFHERFGFRQSLIRTHGLLKVNGLHVSSNAKVLLGANDWLFLTSESVLDYQRHARPFSSDELARWVRTLEDRRAWLAERGIAYMVVIAPNKHSIYPEFLPQALASGARETRLDQLSRALSAGSDVRLINLRDSLLSARSSGSGRLFHKTDTHWNLLGAWYGARAVVDALGPSLTRDSLGREPGELMRRISHGGDLARLLGLASDRLETEVAPTDSPAPLVSSDGAPVRWKPLDVVSRKELIIESAGPGTSAVIFRDSFGEALIPWLSPCFGRATWRWEYGFDRQLIERERPDVVIQQLVERKLMTIAPDGRPISESRK